MHFPGGNHPSKSFSAYQDAFPRWKSSLQELFCISGCISRRESSLQELFCISGCIFPTEIIPARAFLHIRMHFPDGNHPCKSFLAIQDQFPRWKSSLQELFCNSGSIFPAGIIPVRTFSQIRMNLPTENHRCTTILLNQDAFPRWKSSLQELFCNSGSIFPAGIIPTRAFHHIRMHFPAGNHPYKSFSAYQDQFSRRESSL